MEDELSQLDELIESDILDALDDKSLVSEDEEVASTEIDGIVIEDFVDKEFNENIPEEDLDKEIQTEKIENVNINSNDLASLLGQLLNNKTIEITIKIKD